jgi:hypothetical protein
MVDPSLELWSSPRCSCLWLATEKLTHLSDHCYGLNVSPKASVGSLIPSAAVKRDGNFEK